MAITLNNAWKIQAVASTTGSVALGVGNGTAASATAGRVMVVGVIAGGASASHANHQVSDNVNGTTGWVKFNGINVGSPTVTTQSLWYNLNIPSLTSITVNGGTGVNAVTGCIHEITMTGSAFTAGEQTTNSSVSSRTDIPTGTINTATASSILFASYTTGASAAITQAANYTGSNPTGWAFFNSTYSKEDNGVTYWVGGVAYVIVSATQTNAVHHWNFTGTSFNDASVIGALHETSASVITTAWYTV